MESLEILVTMHLLLVFSWVKEIDISWALVAHNYNPSYSVSRDQEDCGLNPAWANNETLSQKTYHKKDWWGGSRYRS
jgi:hypothetical protein